MKVTRHAILFNLRVCSYQGIYPACIRCDSDDKICISHGSLDDMQIIRKVGALNTIRNITTFQARVLTLLFGCNIESRVAVSFPILQTIRCSIDSLYSRLTCGSS